MLAARRTARKRANAPPPKPVTQMRRRTIAASKVEPRRQFGLRGVAR
jgi:hypothetical protein